jgi:hypothetical protein
MHPNGTGTDKKVKCKCGRTLVMHNWYLYSTDKADQTELAKGQSATN